MWGAKPPTFLDGFKAPRGRPDPKIRPKQIRPDCLQVPSRRTTGSLQRVKAGLVQTAMINLAWEPRAGRIRTHAIVYVTQWCFRAGNRASGPDFARILIGKHSKSALRPAEGQPRAILRLSRIGSGQNPARKTGFRPGSIIA